MGTPGLTSHKETSTGNTRKQLWDFLASEAGAVMEEGVLPLAFARGHRPKEKLRGPIASYKILVHLGGSYQTAPGSMGVKKTNPTQHFDRGKEVSQPQVRKAERAHEIIAQARDSTPDSEVEKEKTGKEKSGLSGKEVAIFDQSSSSQAARVLHLDEAVNLDKPMDQPQEVQTLVKTSSAKNQLGGNNTEENPQMSLGQQQLVTQSRQDFAPISTIFLLLLRLCAFDLVLFLSTLPRMSFKEIQSESKKTHGKQEPQQKKLVLSDLKEKNFAPNVTFPLAAGARTQIITDMDQMTSSTQPRMHLREDEKKGCQNFEGEQKQSQSEEKTALVVLSVESMESTDLETRIWPGEELSCKAAGMERGVDGKTNLYVRENLIQIVAE